jgi:hypothetical protein
MLRIAMPCSIVRMILALRMALRWSRPYRTLSPVWIMKAGFEDKALLSRLLLAVLRSTKVRMPKVAFVN